MKTNSKEMKRLNTWNNNKYEEFFFTWTCQIQLYEVKYYCKVTFFFSIAKKSRVMYTS